MPQWYALIDRATGRLFSVGSVVADRRDFVGDFDVVELPARLDQDDLLIYDELVRTFRPRLPEERPEPPPEPVR